MKAELVKTNFTPGIALVVGKPHKNSFIVDSIVLHTAYCVSDTPYYIDYANLDLGNIPPNDTIYICGHGNGKTIGKRTATDIAKILVNRNYIGYQDIYVTSCKSNSKLVKKLKNAILKQLKYKFNATFSFEVESNTPNGSCTVKDKNIVKQYNVRCTFIYQLKELISTIFGKSKSSKKIYFETSNVDLTADEFERENKNKILLLKKCGISL